MFLRRFKMKLKKIFITALLLGFVLTVTAPAAHADPPGTEEILSTLQEVANFLTGQFATYIGIIMIVIAALMIGFASKRGFTILLFAGMGILLLKVAARVAAWLTGGSY